MKKYEIANIRVAGIIGHGDSGKTSLASAMLFDSKMTTRLTSVQEGNSVTDFDENEIERKISISLAPCYLEWDKKRYQIIDTPGYGDFINEAKLGLRVCDSAIITVCSVAGVEVFTEKVWEYADEYKLPRVIFLNKLDRERASFTRTMDNLREIFNKGEKDLVIAFNLPIGEEDKFEGVVDVLTQKGYRYKNDKSGDFEEIPVPENLTDLLQEAREKLIEAAAEKDDTLLEKYLEGEEFSSEEVISGLKKAVLEGDIVPVLCGSALLNIGVRHLLDCIGEFLPSPLQAPAATGKKPNTDEQITRHFKEDEPFSGYVYKTMVDPYAGKITLFRVYSGMLNPDSTFLNVNRDVKERVGQVFFLQGKTQTSVEKIYPGELGAVTKLKETGTGDSIADSSAQILLPIPEKENPMIAYAIVPKAKEDEEKINLSLQKLADEDPTITFVREIQTKQLLLWGMGQQHIEIIVAKLEKRYGVQVVLTLPKIPYRETIRGKTEIQGKYKKQTGGRGQYGDTWLRIEPMPSGGGFVFDNLIVGGVIPKNFIPSVEKGIIGAMQEGALAGFPIVDVRVGLFDGSFHTVDSSDMAFQIAASMGFKKGVLQCNPVLLEPIMDVEVICPEDMVGDIIGDLNGRRGRVQGFEAKGHRQIVKAQVPQAEMLTYASDLRSMTGGRGIFSMKFSHYEELPAHLQEKVIAEFKTGEEE
ncbi:elongation factor G [bacterium]|nr:elongation factor G [bacterium]